MMRRVMRWALLAASTLLAACSDKSETSGPTSQAWNLSSLAHRLGGNDARMVAVLSDPSRALDSLYYLHFGDRGVIELHPLHLLNAIDTIVGAHLMGVELVDTRRAAHDLGFSDSEVLANMDSIRVLYRNLDAYRVYRALTAVRHNDPVPNRALVLIPSPPWPFNEVEQFVLASRPRLYLPTVLAMYAAVGYSKEYYASLGGEEDDFTGYLVPDGTKANSFQHAIMNVLIAARVAAYFESSVEAVAWAMVVADAHEIGSASAGSFMSDMDFHNNAYGREFVMPLLTRRVGSDNFELSKTDDEVRSLLEEAANRAKLVSNSQDLGDNSGSLVYAVPLLRIELHGDGEGRVESPKGSIACARGLAGVTGNCSFSPSPSILRESITLTAIPALGSSFGGWAGDCIGLDACVVAMDQENEIRATFTHRPVFTVTTAASPIEGGSVAGGGTFPSGTRVSLSATANSGYQFSRWTVDGVQLSMLNPLEFEVLSSQALVAHFTLPTAPVVVTVTPNELQLTIGQTGRLTAEVNGSTNDEVAWSTSEPEIATVDPTGLVTAHAVGSAVITARSEADETQTASASVTVESPIAISVSIDPTSASMIAGDSRQFTASVTGSNSNGVQWETSDPSRATVQTDGLVRAVAAGSAKITARALADLSKAASADITISAAPPAVSITISPNSGTMQVGGTLELSASVLGSSNDNVTWGSSNADVATVTSTGRVTGVRIGDVVISAVPVADVTKVAFAHLSVIAAEEPEPEEPEEPSVLTLSASNVGRHGFQMNGRVNPNGLKTTVWFAGGTDPSLQGPLWFSTPFDAGSGTGNVTFSATTNGLNCGTTFYFAAIAVTNTGVTAQGVIRSVRTTSC